MLRRPLTLAALANAAVPGLQPVQVEGSRLPVGARYQQATVEDAAGGRWLVRSALTTPAGAALDSADAIAQLLTKRVPFALPALAGITDTRDGGTVAVYRELPGTPLSFRHLQARSALARSVGNALAQVHDLDPRLYDEAGLPSYDADAYRSRRLAELDRAATTGHVPTGLLARWERALEEVSLWRFATTPTHGPLHELDLRCVDDAVASIDGWDEAAVGDPAGDFAVLFQQASPDALDTVVEAYAQSRRERPDTHLERRIRLAAELSQVTGLMEAAAADDDDLVDRRATALRRLDEQTQDDQSLMPSPVGRRPIAVSAAHERDEEQDEDDEQVDPQDIEVLEGSPSDDEETLELPVGRRGAAQPVGSRELDATAVHASSGDGPTSDEDATDCDEPAEDTDLPTDRATDQDPD